MFLDADIALNELKNEIPWLANQVLHQDPVLKSTRNSHGILETCIIPAPDDTTASEATRTLAGPLKSRLKSLMGRDIEIVFEPISKKSSPANQSEEIIPDGFMVGGWNQAAYLAMQKLFEGDLHNNPLFLHGYPGSGKTFLIQKMVESASAKFPVERIGIIHADELKEKLVEALAENKRDSFRSSLRNYDVFILEDIQSLSRWSVATQEEFIFIFNEYYNQKKPIVITADRPVHELEIFPSLKSRIQSGLSITLKEPEKGFRIQYLRENCEKNNIPCSEKLIELITNRARGSIRELESIINRLYFIQNYKDFNDPEEVWKELKNYYSEVSGVTVEPESILNVVCDRFQISREALLGSSRKSEITRPRHIAMYLATKFTGLSKSAIARFFQRTDHTTVIHAEKKVSRLMETDLSYRMTVEKLVNDLQGARE